MAYIYGPIPSRRLGISLGISPIPKKTCNYACTYCQLGRTNHMTNKRADFFPVHDIIQAFDDFNQSGISYDVVSIVGEGEPTLYKDLKRLIIEIKKRTTKPVSVITNGALLYDEEVRKALNEADIVLPSMDAYDEQTFRIINRPHRALTYEKTFEGLIDFSKTYPGQLWLEIMLLKDVNDDLVSLEKYAEKLKKVTYHKLYLNTPVRPPAEKNIKPVSHQTMDLFSKRLNGIAIDLLSSADFKSDIKDDYEAIKNIIRRHPMNQHEIKGFLKSRACANPAFILDRLDNDIEVDAIVYQHYVTYRLK